MTAIGLLIGIWLVAAGVIRLVRAIVVALHPVLHVVIALVEVFAGIVIVSDPHFGYTALAVITGIWLIPQRHRRDGSRTGIPQPQVRADLSHPATADFAHSEQYGNRRPFQPTIGSRPSRRAVAPLSAPEAFHPVVHGRDSDHIGDVGAHRGGHYVSGPAPRRGRSAEQGKQRQRRAH
ncbi:MAG TPA: hypothetical protein VIX82_07530 [Solirubrobacteraceae bacterium]